MVADRPTHTRQRRLLSHPLSERALREQRGLINRHIEKLLLQLGSRCNEEVDLVDWSNFASMFTRNHNSQLSSPITTSLQLST
jgi:cytochrome P450